ncbi:hypothetical protein ACLK1U_05055 [Escherichia coli]
MAVGARASDVLQQFLIEAVLVCLVGGALGITLSLLIAFTLQLFYRLGNSGFSPLALLLAFLCWHSRDSVWMVTRTIRHDWIQ